MKRFFLALALAAPPAQAIDCSSDCGRIAAFRYPCPTFKKPYRKCDGREPAVWSSCQAAKFASCEVWEGAVDLAEEKVRPHLEGRFNAQTWRQAEDSGTTGDYMASCVAAGVAVCAALGTQLSGPWGAAVTGALGTFVSWRLCDQSRAW